MCLSPILIVFVYEYVRDGEWDREREGEGGEFLKMFNEHISNYLIDYIEEICSELKVMLRSHQHLRCYT